MLQSGDSRPTIASLLSVDSLPLISNLLFSGDSVSPSSSAPASQSENQKSVTFAEPEEIPTSSEKPTQGVNDDAASNTKPKSQSSAENAQLSQISLQDEQNRKNKAIRPRTTYSLAYPHPTPWQKLHIKPRKYLQLQQWTGISSRPLPAYDVLPASCFSATSRKVNAKFRRMSKWRNCFGPDEMFVTRAGEYSSAATAIANADSASISSEESVSSITQDPGSAIAAICAVNARRRKDGAIVDLALDDETVWEATLLANNGGYEFAWTDDHGLRKTVRWVARSSKSRPPRQQRAESWAGDASKGIKGPDSVAERENAGKRFTFSTIDPQSRRHPVIATLTSSCMEVYDTYTRPTTKAFSVEKSPTNDLSEEKDDNLEEHKSVDSADRESTPSMSSSPVYHTDEQIRKLILVSGIWVALQEGWSPNFRYARNGLPAASRLTRSTSSASFTATPQSLGVSANAIPATAGMVNTAAPMRRSRFSSCPSTPLSLSQAAESPSTTNAEAMSPTVVPAQSVSKSTLIPAPTSLTTTETHSSMKSTCTAMIRRASTQWHASPRRLIPGSACEFTPAPALTNGIDGSGIRSYDISATQPEYESQQQKFAQESQPNQQKAPGQVCSAGTVISVACVPSSATATTTATTSPVVSATSVPPPIHHHQTGKLNRIVRGLLVGAVNKMDKHADLANVGHGYVHHRHGLSDIASGMANGQADTHGRTVGDMVRQKDAKDIQERVDQGAIKTARRRTIM